MKKPPVATTSDIHFDITSLFDWFIGIASILIGATLFLFSASLGRIEAEPFLVWVPALKASLILGGLGLILTDALTDRISILWHKLFHLVLIVTYTGYAFFRLQVGDAGGMILFGILVFAMILNLTRLLKGMESFLLFIILSGWAIPLSFFFGPDLFSLSASLDFMLMQPYGFYIVWTIALVLFGGVLWWSHYNKRILFWICMAAYGVIFVFISFWQANSLHWPKSFFQLSIGLTCLLVPAWESLHVHNHRERRIILPIFAVVGTLLLFIVGVIFVMEQNIKEYARREFDNKTAYGEILVDSTVNSIERMVENLERNQTLLEAVDGSDEAKAREVLKVAYEGNQLVRRLLILQANGDFLSSYPVGEVNEKNFAFREYFKEVVKTGETYISQTFDSKTKEKKTVTFLSGPLFSEDNSLKGVVVALVDLDRLSLRLEKIADEEREEHFMLLDKNLKRMINPGRGLIGELVEDTNIVGQADERDDGIGEGYDVEGVRMMQAFHAIRKTGWYIELQAPLAKILSPTKAVSLGFFSIVSILVILVGSFVVIARNRKIL